MGEVEKPKKIFNEKDYIGEIQTIEDEQLGNIEYGELTLEEGNEFKTFQEREDVTPIDISIRMIYLMRKKVVPDLTEEDIRKLPMSRITRLMELMSEHSGFLVQKASTKAKERIEAELKKQAKNLKKQAKK